MLLGADALGRMVPGQISTRAPTPVENVTPDKWYVPFVNPVRFPPALAAAAQPFSAFYPAPLVSFAWFGNLSEPVRLKPRLPDGQQQTLAFNPQPFVSFGWFAELSKPQKLDKPGLSVSAQSFFATDPTVIPVSRLTTWFFPLSEPVRLKPKLPEGEQQYTAYVFSPTQISISWFKGLEEPVRVPPRFRDSLRQFYAGPDRLLPTPSITGTMSALETKDTLLAGGRIWNRILSGEVGAIESTFTGGQSGIIEQGPRIASAQISIRIA